MLRVTVWAIRLIYLVAAILFIYGIIVSDFQNKYLMLAFALVLLVIIFVALSILLEKLAG